ncbi:hypothetical protein C475_16336 [Halosimplex carlsbadense 2-9-1]|uniref:Uncharacterized protein n=1 Tax=Halosimplex carlsbadense 2-9-1 TaxID=797114 RepID=M0CJY9_9EURY|nr:hypothetical protein [Halosimplex carlsbadense]ELZ22687.1 hypothetical protein C475_16336 [Halosimplex carlsbadense 2-9-1]
MDRTVDISGWPTLVFQWLLSSALVLGAVILGGYVCFRAAVYAGVPVEPFAGTPTVVAGAVLWPLLTTLWVRRLRRADSGDWLAGVPREQYTRLAGYGGLARFHWEKSIDRLPDDDED